jgi:hypothetical protein
MIETAWRGIRRWLFEMSFIVIGSAAIIVLILRYYQVELHS